ncbi:MAG: SCP2 sterol-binding domain-containing protein [Chloroflexota bacterium]
MAISPDDVKAVFEKMQSQFNPDRAAGVDAVIQVDLTGENEAHYWLKLNDGSLEMSEGQAETANMTLIATAPDFVSIVNGESNAMQAFMSGKLKVKGDMGLAMKLQPIFGL